MLPTPPHLRKQLILMKFYNLIRCLTVLVHCRDPILRTLFLTSLLLLPSIALVPKCALASNSLPDMGSSANRIMTLEEERELGQEFMRAVRQKLKLIEDPLIDDYVQNLGQRLVSQLDNVSHNYQFFVVDEGSINAFAGPGGYIGVHSGLIFATKTEDELASVLAHEIAHVSQRHLVRSVEQQSNLALPALAAVFAAILLGGGDADIGEALIAGTMAGSIQSQLNFSRNHEAEADNVGIDIMAKAKYDPRYMAVFFETLLSTQRYTEANLPEFILTHPLTASRIAEAKARAESYPKPSTHKYKLNYDLIKSRIHYLIKSKDRYSTTPNVVDSGERSGLAPIDRYRQALDDIQHRQFEPARKLLQQLRSQDQSRIIYIVSQAELELDSGKPNRAINILSDALLNYPGNRPLTELYADALIQGKQPEKARVVLEKHLQSGPHNEKLYQALALSAKQSGKLSEAYEALANYHLLKGETSTAIEHLERAIATSPSDIKRRLVLATQLKKIKAVVALKNQALNSKKPRESRQ